MDVGGTRARTELSKTGSIDDENTGTWTTGVLGLAKFTAQLLYPLMVL